MKVHPKYLLLLIICWASMGVNAQLSPYSIENLLHYHLPAYQFSEDNRFRLAAFSEMKGRYDETGTALSLDFGGLGVMHFFSGNCIFRVQDGRILHLNRFDTDPQRAREMNEALAQVFEKIALLSNYDSDLTLRTVVDKHLAKKNLEPFYKIFVRHLFLKYGKYDPVLDMVSFCSDWMDREPNGTASLVRKPVGKLVLELSAASLHGVYGESQGEVYIETVKRGVYYATGEEYSTNVSAFKIFVQQLLMQSVQYMVVEESNRLDQASAPVYTSSAGTSAASPNAGETLYSPYNWIPMMLGLLRSQNINVGDKDVSMYLIPKPYFPRIYQQMTQQERATFHRNFPNWVNPEGGSAYVEPAKESSF